MTKAQALALVNALETNVIPCDVLLRFDAAGAETWSVQLDTTHVYTGAQLSALTDYCASKGLSLSANVSYLGVT